METQKTELPDLRIVLNGGQETVDNPTIPIKWFFSEELAKKAPQWLLICEKNAAEFNNSEGGRRRLVKVDQAIHFMELHRSGHHRLIVLAFDSYSKASEMIDLYRSGKGYLRDIYDEAIREGQQQNGSLAGAVIDFEVPKELFAQEPKSTLGKALFWYLKWPSKRLDNECNMRRRIITAIPKLLIFLPWQAIRLMFFLVYLAYMLITPPLIWFFGFSPIALHHWRKKIGWAFFYGVIDWEVRADDGDIKYRQLYKYDPSCDVYTAKEREMVQTPFLITLMLAMIYVMIANGAEILKEPINMAAFLAALFFFWLLSLSTLSNLEKKLKESLIIMMFFIGIIMIYLLSLVFVIKHGLSADFPNSGSYITIKWIVYIGSICCLVVLGMLLYPLFKKKSATETKQATPRENKEWKKSQEKARKKAQEEVERKKKEEAYRQYLQENFARPPEEKVRLDNIPDTFDSNKLVRKFRVSYWTLKAKICRPYEN